MKDVVKIVRWYFWIVFTQENGFWTLYICSQVSIVCKVLMVARWIIFKFWWYNQSAYINKDLMKSGLKQLIFSAFFTYGKDMLYLSCLFYLNSFISHTLCSTQGHCERFFVKFHTRMHICTCMWDQFNYFLTLTFLISILWCYYSLFWVEINFIDTNVDFPLNFKPSDTRY